MRNGIPEGLDRLTGHPAIAAGLNERDRRHDGYTPSTVCKYMLNSKERRLRIECVKDGFNKEQINPSVEKAAHLIAIGSHLLVVGRPTRSRIIYIGRN